MGCIVHTPAMAGRLVRSAMSDTTNGKESIVWIALSI